MFTSSDQEGTLPARNERREIVKQAGLIIAQARALCERLDRGETEAIWSVMPVSRDIPMTAVAPATRRSPEVTLQV
jgi:hypothetical protein